ncbi:MAG TPA: polysaccharide pyruvyl transferase family protein [Chthoniobacterales bacterium]|nr:polysaccharide pyruvyl transferase family protein [Chthoniobacterales bacterium]
MNQEVRSVPKLVLLGAGFETGNMGVAALASGTIASALDSFPDAKIYLLDGARESKVYDLWDRDRPLRAELINLRFSKQLFLPNHIVRLLVTALCLRLLPSAARQAFIGRNRWLNVINSADIVAGISGGDSFSDIYGLRRLLYVTLPQLLVLSLGRPLVLLPQTYGPFKGRLAKAIARFVLKRAHRVYSRDIPGAEEVRKLIGDSGPPAEFAYDMGFALEPHAPPPATVALLSQLKHGGSLLGLNASGLLYVGGYTGHNMFGLKADYRKLLLLVVEHFAAHSDCNILLIPHVFGDSQESDTSAAEQFWGGLPADLKSRVHCLEGQFDHHQIKYIIGQCDFFMGSRMHACIAAISQCVPSVALAYSKKFLGVMRSIEMESVVADLSQKDEAEVIVQLNDAYVSRARAREQLETTMPAVKRKVLTLFSKLGQSKTKPVVEAGSDLLSSQPVR